MAVSPRARWWAVRALGLAAILVALLAVLAVLVHTPPIRQAVLRRVAATLEERYALALDARALRYNLFALRVALDDARLASASSPDEPFLEAGAIEVSVPRSALFGAFALDTLRAADARLTIVRRADGTTNLPEPPVDEAGTPAAALRIEHVDVPRLAIDVRDESEGLALSIPALSLDVRPDSGRVQMAGTGRLRRGGVETNVTRLGGGLAFDGRALTLTDFTLATDEARAAIDGSVALLVDEPRVDLRFAGDADAGGLARWAMASGESLPQGRFSFDGAAEGAFDAPAATARVRDGSIAWQGIAVSQIEARIAAGPTRVDIPEFGATVADGRVRLDGVLPLDGGEAELRASWSSLDLATLVHALSPQSDLTPDGRATGNATFSGPLTDVAGWTLQGATRIVAGRAAPGRLAIAGDLRAALEEGTWQIEGEPRVAGITAAARLGGRLDAASPADSTVTGTIVMGPSSIAGILDALRSAGLADVAGSPASGTVDLEAAVAGTLSRPRLQITARGESLAAANVTGVTADLTAEGTTEEMAFSTRFRQDSANVVIATGTVWPREARLDARVSGTVNDVPRLAPGVPIGGVVNLQLDAAGPLDALTANGTVGVDDASYAAFRIGRIDAEIGIDPDAARASATAGEIATSVAATVTRRGERRATVDVQVSRADIARLVRDASLPVPVAGEISLTARAEAPVERWRQAAARVDVSQLEARIGELPVALDAPARVSYEQETIAVERLEAAAGGTSVSMAGRLRAFADADPLPAADALQASLVGNLQQTLDALRDTGLVAMPGVRGTGALALLARVTGSADRPVVAGDVELGPARLAFDVPSDGAAATYEAEAVRLRAHVEDGWLDLLNASGEWQGSRIAAEGRAPLSLFEPYLPEAFAGATAGAAGGGTLSARALSITPRVLAPFVGPDVLEQIDGNVDASAELRFDALDPAALRGEVRLDALAIRVADLPVSQREPTRVTFEDGVARVAAWNWVGQGASLDVQGDVRLADRQAVLRAAGRLDLRMLTPFVRDAGLTPTGTLIPLVAITGRLDDPAVNAEVRLAGGGLRLAEPRVIAAGVDARAVVSQIGAEIVELAGTVNGGVLSGGGRVTYGGAAPPAARLDVNVAGMALEFPEGLRSELDADLALALTGAGAGAAGALSGTVTVLRSAYREPLAVVTGLLGALRSNRLVTTVSESETFANRLALDVRVVTESDVIVDNNLARLQLGGDLRVIGTAAAPALSGQATLREGGELFLGRNRYTIEPDSTIGFENPFAIEPDLDVVARTRAGGQEIELTLQGTPETLTPELRAPNAPELGQADLASLLLTGRTLDEVPGAEGRIVGEQVLSFLSGDVLGAVSRVVGLDTIRLGGVEGTTVRRDPSAIVTETDPTSRLTFGKSLGEQLELTLSQSLRSGDAQTWIVDYTPISQVALRLVSGDDTLRAYEFRHDLAFGAQPPRVTAAPRAEARELPVSGVTLDGELEPFEAGLRAELRLEPGDAFDFTEWQRDRDRLEAFLHRQGRREARVTTTRVEDASGVAIAYAIDVGPRTAISVEGHDLRNSTLQALDAAWRGSVFDDFLEEEAAGIVRTALAEDGYLRAEVSAEILAEDDRKTLGIAITPGDRIRGRRIAIDAPDEQTADDVDRWIRRQGLDEAAWRDPSALERSVATYLQQQGHLAASVRAESPAIEDGTAILPLTVRPGPVFVTGEARFDGVGRLGADEVRSAAALEPGTPFVAEAAAAARTRVLDTYRREGFADVQVTVHQRVDTATERVDLVFTIEEGPRQVLREVAVEGNRAIDTDVVTRALDLEIGEPLGTDDWLQARARLFDTALFRRVDVTTEPVADAPAADGERPMRVQAAVQEWPALRLRYGFQVSEERPEGEVEGRDLVPGLSADLTRRTLFGRAITTGGAVQYQRRDRTVRLFADAPTMLGLPIESLVTAYRSRQEFVSATLLTDRTGVSWEQRLRITPSFRVSYSYAFDRDHTFETEPDPDSFFPAFDVTVNVARFNTAAVYDTRNDPLDTASGMLLSSSLDYASEGLGSDVGFVGHLGQAYYFRPWRRIVFASAARLGLVTPLGGQPLIPSERYFGGGARTVRGVREDGLGPRDFEGEAAGGGALLVFNQEVRFPIFRWVRGVAFTDVGNVFTEPSAIDFGALVGSAGAGLRVTTPFALLRVDYGRVFTGTDGHAGGRWTFGIGQSF